MSHFDGEHGNRHGIDGGNGDGTAGPLPWEPYEKGFLIAGGVGLAICALAFLIDRPAALTSYLAAYLFWLGIALGSLAFVMLHYLVGGFWGFLIRRPMVAAMSTLPLMAALFLPLLIDMGAIYPWARPGASADPSIHHKQPYLNVGFFVVRALIYFGIWNLLAFLMRQGAARQDRSEGPSPTWWTQRFAGPGLVLYFLSMTFAAVDWGMSLEPHWFSTIYGVMLMIGQGLSALSAMVIVATLLSRTRPLSGLAKPGAFHDIGNLMLAFTMLWAYMAFSQYLIIWYGNLTEEIPWYLNRSVGLWRPIAASLILVHFFLPFFLLLNREAKRQPQSLWKIAALILAVHALNDAWLILPSQHGSGVFRFWSYPAALVGIGGLWLTSFTRQLKSRPLVPRNDPLLAEALVHQGAHHE